MPQTCVFGMRPTADSSCIGYRCSVQVAVIVRVQLLLLAVVAVVLTGAAGFSAAVIFHKSFRCT
jgi:hypothetical protein